MKKIMLFATPLVVGAFLFLFGAFQGQSDNRSLLRFATCADYPPFEYMRGGELVGFDIELAREIAKDLGSEAEFLDVPFSSVLVAVDSGLADMAIATITKTTMREQSFDFSEPYYTECLAMVYYADAPIESAAQLEGKKIACQLGTTMELWLKEHVPSAAIVATDSNPQAIEMLKAQHVDGVYIDCTQAVEFCAVNPELQYKPIAHADTGYAVAFKKESALKDRVNASLKRLEAAGVIARLRKTYVGS